MPQVINTNIYSLNAQRNLNTSQSALAVAMQRLSSGLRVNSAKDDAAGLAISERMTTQIRGLNMAVRNANDGISLAQTAEGALGSIGNNLQRIRELAVQSANATNSASDRAALDAEVQQLKAEIERVASQTSFNNLKILDGTYGKAAFQVGANVGEIIQLTLETSMRTASVGAFVNQTGTAAVDQTFTPTAATAVFTVPAAVAAIEDYTGVSSAGIDTGANKVTVNGTDVRPSATYAITGDSYRGADSAFAKAAAINGSGVPNVTASASTSKTIQALGSGRLVDFSTANIVGTDTMGYSLSINGVQVIDPTTTGLFTATNETMTVTAAVAAINLKSGVTGVVASEDASGNLILTADDGRNISVQEAFTFTETNGATDTNDSSGAFSTALSSFTLVDTGSQDDSGTYAQAALTWRGQVSLQSSADVAISAGNAVIGFGVGTLTAASSIEAQNVLSVTAAYDTMRSVDSALTAVNGLRAELGAIQSRFESTITNLATTAENLSASRSRIMDADFAAETAALSRAQILQQAGTAMVAQANQVPQSVLQLLK